MSDIEAYDREARPIFERSLGKRGCIPSHRYNEFLDELKPVFIKHFGTWPEPPQERAYRA